MLKIPYWIIVHKSLIKYKKIISQLFLSLSILGFLLIIFGFYSFNNFPSLYYSVFSLRNKFGTLSLLLFVTTLLPGILTRFKIFPLFSASIVIFRRQIGILMFVTALIHSFYVTTILSIMTSTFNLKLLTSRELSGSIALLILFPAWLTSNDFSLKKMGKFWKIIQRLTYFSLIVIMIHASSTSVMSGFIAYIILVFELLSWLKIWFLDRNDLTYI